MLGLFGLKQRMRGPLGGGFRYFCVHPYRGRWFGWNHQLERVWKRFWQIFANMFNYLIFLFEIWMYTCFFNWKSGPRRLNWFSIVSVFAHRDWGLGGGTMQSYMAAACPKSSVLTVEASPAVLAAAKDFFGFDGNWAGSTIQFSLECSRKNKMNKSCTSWYAEYIVNIYQSQLSANFVHQHRESSLKLGIL